MKKSVVSFLSQKGGVGKSTLACMLAVRLGELNNPCWLVDMDISQGTSSNWASLRSILHGEESSTTDKPEVEVVRVSTVTGLKKLLNESPRTLIIDPPGQATIQTLEIARISDLCLLPTTPALHSLSPQLNLAEELMEKGIDRERVFLVGNLMLGTSQDNIIYDEARKRRLNIVSGSIPHKASFTTLTNSGQALGESPYQTVRERVNKVLQEILTLISSHVPLDN